MSDPHAQNPAHVARISRIADVAAAPRPAITVLRPGDLPTRGDLQATLNEFTAALEDGLSVIDSHLSCDTFGEIDLLAVDRAQRLVIIDIATSRDDGLMMRGVSHLEWMVRNTANLRRMHRGVVADFSSQPRLFLVAPEFSPVFKSAVRQIPDLEIVCVRYHAIDLHGRPAIFFEPLTGDSE